MAYIGSNWHTYWSSTYSKKTQFKFPTKKLKNRQVLEISDEPIMVITYGSLNDMGLGTTLDRVRDFYYKSKRPSAEEMYELIPIFDEFKNDVDEHFRFWTFMKYEWWIPLRNKIRLWLNTN